MMGMQSKDCPFTFNGANDLDLANDLNFSFNVHDFSEEVSVFRNSVSNPVQSAVSVEKEKESLIFSRGQRKEMSQARQCRWSNHVKLCGEA